MLTSNYFFLKITRMSILQIKTDIITFIARITCILKLY